MSRKGCLWKEILFRTTCRPWTRIGDSLAFQSLLQNHKPCIGYGIIQSPEITPHVSSLPFSCHANRDFAFPFMIFGKQQATACNALPFDELYHASLLLHNQSNYVRLLPLIRTVSRPLIGSFTSLQLSSSPWIVPTVAVQRLTGAAVAMKLTTAMLIVRGSIGPPIRLPLRTPNLNRLPSALHKSFKKPISLSTKTPGTL